MQWHQMFQSHQEPSMRDIEEYVGGAKELWSSLVDYFESAYKAKPRLAYSGCGMKPGWNVKFQKRGQNFGTLYPLEGAFDVMVVVSYKLDEAMRRVLPELSPPTAQKYRDAQDYMKLGRWMMLRVDDEQSLEDYKKIAAVKLPPAANA